MVHHGAMRGVLLALICVMAVAVRLFPVVKWGSVIHEFDPHFNYRVTRLMRAHGVSALRDWFDDRAWYPLGRSVGETVYPGLMIAAIVMQWISETVFRMPMDTRDACVFVAPVFAAFACLAIYALTLQVTRTPAPALLAAALFSMCPAYISRSTAGSFDNEGVAIFLLVVTFWLWVRAVASGSMLTAGFAALSYFAMVVSWGGYVFVINLIPLHVLLLVVSGRYSSRVYIAYATFYPLATLLAMQVPFVGFNAITKGETAGSHAVFLALQAFAFARFLQSQLSSAQFTKLLALGLAIAGSLVALAVVAAMALGKVQWSGRSLTLLDPTYASKYIPIIASVGEHQPTSWGSFYLSLGPLVVLAPLGLFYCVDRLDDAYAFLVLYAAFAFYFAGIMVRLLLTLAPAACMLSAIGLSECMTRLARVTRQQLAEADDTPPATTEQESEELQQHDGTQQSAKTRKKQSKKETPKPPVVVEKTTAVRALERQQRALKEREQRASFWSDLWNVYAPRLRMDPSTTLRDLPARTLSSVLWLVFAATAMLLLLHMRHCVKVSHIAFSSTSMTYESSHRVHDDYREAYAWLRANTEPNAKILGWWDYGYQLSALANRTVIVDNNTWNNTHIATVGRVLTSSEDDALPILQSLDVDYVFLLFGGRIGMHGDDLDKLPWILRISQDVFTDEIFESEFTVNGRYLYDSANATSAMQQSLLYKMSYYRFFDDTPGSASDSDAETELPSVVDKSRGANTRIDARNIRFTHLEEAFTSDAWIVRIYRVKKRS